MQIRWRCRQRNPLCRTLDARGVGRRIPTVVGIDMAKGATKLSISVPGDLAKTVRKRVGARGLSGFVTRAMRHELEREQLGAFVAELDEELGPVSKKSLAEARAAWRGR